jgi:hypothetical protein
MLKRIFADDGAAVGTVLGGNIALSWAVNFASVIGPWLNVALSLGQLAVTVATVWYVIRKARAVRVPPPPRRKQKR